QMRIHARDFVDEPTTQQPICVQSVLSAFRHTICQSKHKRIVAKSLQPLAIVAPASALVELRSGLTLALDANIRSAVQGLRVRPPVRRRKPVVVYRPDGGYALFDNAIGPAQKRSVCFCNQIVDQS